ncbi:MAG TPA: outer membrane lipid asymmetry maintenance protein MlaD [Gammaproteobacteria bacterium]|nr:outer membrane lipid asymmetry maintenance protein MlaD [Gammaproteobacteria bacterium]
MHDTRNREIAVGIFVAIGLAALLMLSLQVSNISNFTGGEGYTLSARFDNIGGLKVKSPVRIGGVRIGRITDISYDEKIYEAVVTMRIQQQQNRIPDDTIANIYTAGLLGEQYIGLEPGGSETFLTNGDEFSETTSAIVLERLIGEAIFSKKNDP